MNIEQVKTLKYRQVLEHFKMLNNDGTKLRARVNGKVKTWKRDPSYARVPLKHGLYTYFYIDNENCHEWELEK